jgi:hypothetical protein
MVFRRFSMATMLALVAALLTGCGGVSSPSKNKVEDFSGTLGVAGTVFFNYSWDKRGEIEVTMKSVTPTPTNPPIWIFVGQRDNSGNCFQLLGYSAAAIVNRPIPFGELDKGNYCLGVYDPGGALTVPVNFAGTFSHP